MSAFRTPRRLTTTYLFFVIDGIAFHFNSDRTIFRPPLDRLPNARLRGIDRAQDLLLPGGFASVDQDLVNALLANDVGLGRRVRCCSTYKRQALRQ